MTAHERMALSREGVTVVEPDPATLHPAPAPGCLRLHHGPAFVHVRPDGSGWRHCGPYQMAVTPEIYAAHHDLRDAIARAQVRVDWAW